MLFMRIDIIRTVTVKNIKFITELVFIRVLLASSSKKLHVINKKGKEKILNERVVFKDGW